MDERLRLQPAELAAILAGLIELAIVTPGQLRRLGVTRDPKDDAIVACAEEGHADPIVSDGGSDDGHLPSLGEYRDIQAVKPRRVLELIAQP